MMKGPELEKMVCIIKRTELEWYRQSEGQWAQAEAKARLDPEWMEEKQRSHDNHHAFVKELQKATWEMGLNVDYFGEQEIAAAAAQIDQYQMAISCGGDGSVVSVANHLYQHPILAMNSDWQEGHGKGSEGALTSVNKTNLVASLEDIKAGRYEIEKWSRLYAAINGERIPQLATNDVVISNLGGSSDFILKYGKNSVSGEGTSGIAFATGMGSTAWFRNIGGTPFDPKIEAIGFIAREYNRDRNPMIAGIVHGDTVLEYHPDRSGHTVMIDGRPITRKLELTDILTVGLDDSRPVYVAIPHNGASL